jgi:hypothetical protein
MTVKPWTVFAVGLLVGALGIFALHALRQEANARDIRHTLTAEAAAVEYKVVEFTGRDADEYTKQMNDLAAKGWEFAGTANIFTSQANGTTNVNPIGFVVMKRAKK